MTVIKFYIFSIFIIGFFACKSQTQPTQSKDFTIEVKSLQADTVITSAVYFGGYIFCLQANHKIFVLDTLLQKHNTLTAKFSNLKADLLHPFNDTIFIGTNNNLYFIDQDVTLKHYNSQPFKYGLPYYNDDTYYVHACSVGEWGGAVFFWNKKTNKTYSYPATDVQQVFKFGDTYVVSSYLAHLSGISDFLFIKDPTKLYELKNERQKTFCNWYMSVDSLKDTKLYNTATPVGVTYYSDTFTTRTITTFPYNNGLYSIYCTDSATILATFQNSKLIPIDTVLRHKLTFHNAKTHLTNNTVVTAYAATWAIGGEGNSWTPYQTTGLVFTRNNKITFLEFQTPHMWTNNSR